jgi:uncharacterized membrane protein YebE (DUF533 family)
MDARQLLDSLMGSGMAPSSGDRIGHALGASGMGGQGGLLDSLLGGAGGAGGPGGIGGQARDMLGNVGAAVKRGDPMAIGGLGALAGALLGGGGRTVGGAIGGGAMALLASLAFNALRNKAGAAAGAPSAKDAPLGLRPAAGAAEERDLEKTAQLMLRAMIEAAKADGQVDPSEMERILGKLAEAGASAEERATVARQLAAPANMAALAAEVRDPTTAAEVYAASLLAVEIDTDAERTYLQRLAAALKLEPQVTKHLHKTLGVPA